MKDVDIAKKSPGRTLPDATAKAVVIWSQPEGRRSLPRQLPRAERELLATCYEFSVLEVPSLRRQRVRGNRLEPDSSAEARSFQREQSSAFEQDDL